MTVAEYLRFEERSTIRHEYVGGHVYAMSGATARHEVIAGNVFVALHAAARRGGCRAFTGNMRVQVGEDRIYYPDASVTCGPIDGDALVVRDPCLVVEVLSRSTHRVDRGEKLDAYRSLPSLRSYLVVEPRARLVEHHWRDADGAWRREAVTDADPGGALTLPCPGVTLTLDAIYHDVDGLDAGRRPPLRVREG